MAVATTAAPKREINVEHCIATRKAMEETADRIIFRDHEHHTGSDEWLHGFNKKYLPTTSRWD